MIHSDFNETHPENQISYELYRKILKELKISFASIGHEECEQFKLHGHDRENIDPGCDICKEWSNHHNYVVLTPRQAYQTHAESAVEEGIVIIMLPRLDMFKKVIFTPRLIAYHETFAPIGQKGDLKPHAIIWHETISGRNKEDIISCFYKFLKINRDIKNFVIWLDNCSSQNKYWCHYSFLVQMVNSSDIEATEICLHYFEPDHSFMNADSFHHQVELSLNKHFEDFASANSGRVEVLKTEISDFYKWEDYTSQAKLKKSEERAYMKDIVEVNIQYFTTRLNYLL